MREEYQDKLQRQIANEKRYLEKSKESFYRQFKKLAGKGAGDRTKLGRDMISSLIEKMENAIEIEIGARLEGKATQSTAAVAALPIEASALIGLQNLMRSAMSGATRQATANTIGQEVEYEVNARKLETYSSGAYKSLQRRLQTSCPTERSKISLRNSYQKYWYKDQINPIELSKDDKLRSGMFILGLAEEIASEWIVRTNKKDRREKYTRKVYQFTAEFAEIIKKHTELMSLASPQFPPLVIPPNDWSGVLAGGKPYYTVEMNKRARFIRSKDFRYLREMGKRAHSEDPAKDFHMQFDAVNKAQKTAWKINSRILDTLNECIRFGGGEIWALPIVDPAQLPSIKDKPTGTKEFRKAQKVRNEMITKSVMLRGQIAVATEFVDEEEIYFAMAIDSRGRGYYVYGGNFINPQGNDISRSLLTFANGEELGRQDAADWLYYGAATIYGVDKVSRQERIEWVEENLDIILACARDPFEAEHRKFWIAADKPWQFLAYCFEIEGYQCDGLKHVTYLPIHLDGCQNALQHVAAMMRDSELAKRCGVIDTGSQPDLYSDVAARAIDYIKIAAENSYTQKKFGDWDNDALEELAQEYWNKLKDKDRHDEKRWSAHLKDVDELLFPRIITDHPEVITRSMCKRPVMTFIYDSKPFSRKDYIADDLTEQLENGTTIFTDCQRWRLTTYLEPLLSRSTEEILSGATEYLRWLKEIGNIVATRPDIHSICPDCGKSLCKCECAVSKKEKKRRKLRCNCHSGQLGLEWVTPFGFPVIHRPVELVQRQIKTTVGSISYTLVYSYETQSVNKEKLLSGVAANFTHSYDAAMLWDVVLECREDIGSIALIHDSFGTLATKTSLLRHILKRCFVKLYSHRDHLESYRACAEYQLKKSGRDIKLPLVPQRGDLNIEEAMKSDYLFC